MNLPPLNPEPPPECVVVLELPVPPSSNRYWRSLLLKGRSKKTKANPDGWASVMVRSTEARVYIQNTKVAFHQQIGYEFRPFIGRVAVTITWRRERRAGDLDNRVKILLDAIKGLAYEDDGQIVEEHAYRIDGETPGMTVRIVELP